MVLFNDRLSFDKMWFATSFRVVIAGMGDDTAILIAEMYKRGYEPDEIVFCDTGSDFEHAYHFSIGWLKSWYNEKNGQKWSFYVSGIWMEIRLALLRTLKKTIFYQLPPLAVNHAHFDSKLRRLISISIIIQNAIKRGE